MSVALTVMVCGSLSVGGADPLREFVAAHERARLAQVRTEVAWGELCEGRMVDRYRECQELLSPISGVLSSLYKLDDQALSRDERVRAFRPVWQLALQQMSRGAHAADASYAWRSLSSCPGLPDLWAVRIECRLLLQEGRELEAVRLSLDYMTQQVDTSLYLGNGSFGVVRAGLEANDWSSRFANGLGDAARAELDRGVGVLVRRMPRCDPLRDRVAASARVSVLGEGDYSVGERLSAWRDGFQPGARLREYLEAVVRAEPIWSQRPASIGKRSRLLDRARAVCPKHRSIYFVDAKTSEGWVRSSIEHMQQLRHLLR